MKNNLFILLFIILSGCFFKTPPPGNLPFKQVKDISVFDGTYKNLGLTNDDAKRYLSGLIWPKDKLDHASILTIEVKSNPDKTLIIKAHGVDKVIKEEILVEGRDFKLNKEGKILLTDEAHFVGAEPGEAMVGGYTIFQELGLDQAGHGKLHEKFSTAGLVFMVLPVAMHVGLEVRFERIE